MDALWPAVIAMLTLQATRFDIALALTALLAVSVRDPLWLFECALAERPRQKWLPWLALAVFAVASFAFGILDPQQIAAAFEMMQPLAMLDPV